MLRRCIMLIPNFVNGRIIDDVRAKYDPFAKHVKPHITLAFPFDSNIETNQLREHLSSVLSGCEPFELILNGITPARSLGKYLFLNIQTGTNKIVELHKKIYTGILDEYYPDWLKGNDFLPHMTVGSFDSEEDLILAISETVGITDLFKTIVNKVIVEIIDENEDSIIELNISLE